MEDCIKRVLIGGGSSRHLNTSSNLFIVAVPTHISIHVAIVDHTDIHNVENNWNILYLVAIADCTRVGSITASFEDLVTLFRRTLHQIFFIKDQLAPLLVTVDQERELLKPRS